MAKQPPKSDEEDAKAALEDLKANLGLPKTLAEYDQRYIVQRILRAIWEAKDVHPLSKVPDDVLLPAMEAAVKKRRGI
jgi:hypothetical protein